MLSCIRVEMSPASVLEAGLRTSEKFMQRTIMLAKNHSKMLGGLRKEKSLTTSSPWVLSKAEHTLGDANNVHVTWPGLASIFSSPVNTAVSKMAGSPSVSL